MSNRLNKTSLVAGIGVVWLVFGIGAAQAAPYDFGYYEQPPVGHGQAAAPAVVPLGPGLGVVGPGQVTASGRRIWVPHYQGPDGRYDNLVDLSREVNGVPCGMACQERALRRWGYNPAF